MKFTEQDLKDAFARNPDLARRNKVPGCVVSTAEPERSLAPEPMAKITREAPCQERRLVRIASFRVKLADYDNVYIKDVLDALKESGAIFDDAQAWCKTEVTQCVVPSSNLERTEITIERLI